MMAANFLLESQTEAFHCVHVVERSSLYQDFVARPIWPLRNKSKLYNEHMYRVACVLVDWQEVCVVSAKL